MFGKTIFSIVLCVILLAVTSCSVAETEKSEKPAKAAEKKVEEKAVSIPEKAATDSILDSEVIIQLGDEKLTRQQIEWMQPNADSRQIASIANWWLENELLYTEAQRRGIISEPKAEFLAGLMSKKTFSQELRLQVQEAAKVGDKDVLAYYEKNKTTDPKLSQPGYLGFSHVKTKTLEQAKAVLERIKAGEDIGALAKELSIHKDAKKGGILKRYKYKTVEKRFGKEFFEAVVAAEKNGLIGPVKVKDGAYEVARQIRKTEPKILPFARVEGQIRSKLQRTEKSGALTSLLDSLRENAADKIVKSPRIVHISTSADNKRRPPKKNIRPTLKGRNRDSNP